MGKWGWMLKHVALDAWEARGALARRWSARAMVCALVCAAGAASWAGWGMASFPKTGWLWVGQAPQIDYASAPGCERALAGLPEALRDRPWAAGPFAGPGASEPVKFACRKEAGAEFMERRRLWDFAEPLDLWARRGAAERRMIGSWTRLDHLKWEPQRARAGWEAMAQIAGLEELGEASRGLAASTDAAGAPGALAWAGRIMWGLALAPAWLVWALVWISPAALLCVMGVAGWRGALWAMERRGWPSGGWARRALGWCAGLAAGALMAPAGLMANAAASWAWSERLGEEWAMARMQAEELVDCDDRVGRGSSPVMEEREWRCREEGGATLLVAVNDGSWTDQEARERARRELGLSRSRLGESEPARAERSWGAFEEMAGWAEPTRASRAWASETPRGWGRDWRQTAELASAGGWRLLCLAGLLWLAWAGLRRAPRALRGVGRGLERQAAKVMEDPEFQARAQRRELGRLTEGEGSAGKGVEGARRPRRL